MRIHLGALVAVVGLIAIGSAQDEGGLKKRAPKAPVVVSSAPVTRAEAQATFARLNGLFKTVLHQTVSPMQVQGSLNGSITRSEVIAEFARIHKALQPAFTLTPRPLKVDLGRLIFDKPSERPQLIKLVEGGFVGNYSRLATGSVITLSVHEFGDAVGYFFSRIGECTHVPSSKWTPYLHG